MDKRKNNGGHPNCGRKSKAEELKLVERLGPLETKAFKALKKGIEVGDFKYVQLFYHYYAGKPKESKDITINAEQPLFTLDKD